MECLLPEVQDLEATYFAKCANHIVDEVQNAQCGFESSWNDNVDHDSDSRMRAFRLVVFV